MSSTLDGMSSQAPRRRRGESREKLLAASLAILVDEGYDAATTGRIARAAGLKQPSFYRHFESREACLREAILREGQLLADSHATRRAGLDDPASAATPESLREGFTLFFAFVRARPAFAHVLFALRDAPHAAGDAVREVLARLRDELVADLPRFGIDPPPNARMRADLLQAMTGQVLRGVAAGDYDLDAATDLLVAQAHALFEVP